jgi:catechol 2,3-dioxygenase-like lactoylglutathione lyase family enzyme
MRATHTGAALQAGIVARDPARMLSFYGDFLGLKVVDELEAPEHGIHIWFLAAGAGFLKILELSEPPVPSNPVGGIRGGFGIRYLTFEVANIEEAIEGLEEAGGRLTQPVTPVGDSRVVIFDDPEANAVELVDHLRP